MDGLEAHEEAAAYALIDRMPDLAQRAAEMYPPQIPLGEGALYIAARDVLVLDGLTKEEAGKNRVALNLLAGEIRRIRVKNSPATSVPVEAPRTTEHVSELIRGRVSRLLVPIYVGGRALEDYRRFLARSLSLTLDAPELAYAVRDLGLRIESLLACIIAIKQARDFPFRIAYYANRVRRTLSEKSFEDDEETVEELMALDIRELTCTGAVPMASPPQAKNKTAHKNGSHHKNGGKARQKR